MVMQK